MTPDDSGDQGDDYAGWRALKPVFRLLWLLSRAFVSVTRWWWGRRARRHRQNSAPAATLPLASWRPTSPPDWLPALGGT